MVTSAELVWLLALVAKGDVAAFERLYGATRAKLYGVVLRILRRPELASEALQDAYLRIWTQAARFDPAGGSPITWMVAIARSRAIDVARRAGDLPAEADDADAPEVAAESDEPPASRTVNDDLKRLLAGLGRLDPDRQRMLLLAYFSGVDRAELAREFDRPVNTVRTQLRRALADLRECLGT